MSGRKAYVVADGLFGDCGKGHLVDFLCREHDSDLVVRYTGGPQATHHVVLTDGREHCFGSFGSGMFLPNVRTYISRHTLIDPFAIRNEAHALGLVGVKNAMDRLTVHPDCRIISPFCWQANRIKEILRGDARHGSCGMGLGECRAIEQYGLTLRVSDLGRPAQGRLRTIRNIAIQGVEEMRARVTPEVQTLYESMLDEDIDQLMDFYNEWARSVEIRESLPLSARPVIFEGSQGVLLDEDHGFAPYHTWSKTDFTNALELCQEEDLAPTRILVFRTYATRHGAGPFPTEKKDYNWPDRNPNGPWQGPFRQGAFDMPLAKYAVQVCGGADEICLTHMDRVSSPVWEFCVGHRMSDGRYYTELPENVRTAELMQVCPVMGLWNADGMENLGVAEFIADELGVPVRYRSYGPRAMDFHVAAGMAGAGGD